MHENMHTADMNPMAHIRIPERDHRGERSDFEWYGKADILE